MIKNKKVNFNSIGGGLIRFLNYFLSFLNFRLIQTTSNSQHKLSILNHDFIRLETLEMVSQEIYSNGIKGNVAELGVYQGKFACQINRMFPDRKLFLFDTFTGFAKDDAVFDNKSLFSNASQNFSNTSIELVKSKMQHKELCVFKKGYFPDTAKDIKNESFCFVSLDADLYKPTKAGLEFFWPRLVHGGTIMVHDFEGKNYLGVRKAVVEFCNKNQIGYLRIADAGGSIVLCK